MCALLLLVVRAMPCKQKRRLTDYLHTILQGLLDLEGDSLTPILVSLVKKDAHMLDAFGKGASEDIRLAKQARGFVIVALLCTFEPL